MKRLLVLFLLSAPAAAAPFIVSDPVAPNATHCGFLLDAAAKVELPVAKDAAGVSICKIDIGNVTAGSHSIKATAIMHDPVWGDLESVPSLPLAFVRPASPPTPAGLTLKP